MSSGVIKGNVGELFVLSNGEIKDPKNLKDFHPNSNVNLLIVNIEDGGGENTMAQINFAPENRKRWSSVWFPLFLRGTYQKKISNEPNIVRTFAQYVIPIPSVITNLNLDNVEPLNIKITFRQLGGIELKGQFDSVNALNNEYPPTQELSENLSVAYVYDMQDSGIYQVEYNDNNSVYEWVKVDRPTAYLESKAYNMGNIQVQGGFGSNVPIQTLVDAQYNLIWYELAQHGGYLDGLQDQIDYINSTDLVRIEGKIDNHIANIGNVHGVKGTEIITGGSNNNIKDRTVENALDYLDGFYVGIDNDLQAHKNNKNNPHEVKGGQVEVGGSSILSGGSVNTAIDWIYNFISDLELDKENKSNKATNFNIKNNTLYPSVLAVFNELVAQLNAHDIDHNAHPFLKGLIDNLQAEVNRINAKGKSYGAIDKLQSELILENDINAYILNFLQNKFDGYVAEIGDLIYTKPSDTENEHEWEYNGSNWVDNGAYTIGNATDSAYGLVKGNDYVSIANGLMTIIKSNYAERLGDTNNNITFSQLDSYLTTLFNDLSNTYRKDQVYTKAETNLIIAKLKSIYGWSESDLATLSNAETYPIDTEYSFLVLEEDLNGETTSYIIIVNNLVDTAYGTNISVASGVITYSGSETVKITGYTIKDNINVIYRDEYETLKLTKDNEGYLCIEYKEEQ